jgi:hypothetical protein
MIHIYFLPLEHECGCCIEWGVDERMKDQLPGFLVAAAPYPCPMHGSASGEHASPLVEEEIRFLVANGVHYRLIPKWREEKGKIDANRNRRTALGHTGGVEVHG